jgi:hypothetical protein
LKTTPKGPNQQSIAERKAGVPGAERVRREAVQRSARAAAKERNPLKMVFKTFKGQRDVNREFRKLKKKKTEQELNNRMRNKLK